MTLMDVHPVLMFTGAIDEYKVILARDPQESVIITLKDDLAVIVALKYHEHIAWSHILKEGENINAYWKWKNEADYDGRFNF